MSHLFRTLIEDFVDSGEPELIYAYMERVHRWLPQVKLPYHDLDHARDVALECRAEGLADKLSDDTLLGLCGAAWFHDTPYVPGAKDNEVKAAALFEEHWGLDGWTRRVGVNAILTTRYLSDDPLVKSSATCQIISDADLRGLASPSDRYWENTHLLRIEFSGFTDEQWREGRRAFLTGFLARPRLFWRRTEREAPARLNMQRELESLS